MILDFNPISGFYTLHVRRGAEDIRGLMRDYGLDLSVPASTPQTAVLFTREPYAAASFLHVATPRAKEALGGIADAIRASRAPVHPGTFLVPADKELWNFQRASVAYALDTLARGHGALVADQPGLGKTPIAITIANELRATRVLVVCPANIRLQWAERIYEWTMMRWPFTVHSVLAGRHGVNPDAAWTIISYDLARSAPIKAALMAQEFDLLILDEAHMLKTASSQRSHAVLGKGIASRARHVVALTGTPLPNRPREAYTIARQLDWEAIDWMSETAFAERFNPMKVVEWTHPQTGAVHRRTEEKSGRHPELQNRLRANFMVRHLKRDVMTQLQLPAYDLIHVEETKSVRAALAAESLLEIDPDRFLMNTESGQFQGGHIAEARRMMGEAIAPWAADYIEMLLDGGEEKLVVFGWHIAVLDILERRLARFHPLRIDGRTSPVGKRDRVQRFIKEPSYQVMIGNIQSMGVGTDGLQYVSSHAVIVEPSWTPADNEQAFDRLDRGGQRNAVQGDILVAKGSIAEKILGAALRKGRVIHTILDHTLVA